MESQDLCTLPTLEADSNYITALCYENPHLSVMYTLFYDECYRVDVFREQLLLSPNVTHSASKSATNVTLIVMNFAIVTLLENKTALITH